MSCQEIACWKVAARQGESKTPFKYKALYMNELWKVALERLA
jgi:hypothetical protein